MEEENNTYEFETQEAESKKVALFTNPDNWKPNLTKMAEESGFSLATINRFHKKLIQQNRIKTNVEIITEEEAYVRFIEEKRKNGELDE